MRTINRCCARSRYSSTSDNPSTAPRGIDITITDGALTSNTGFVQVNVVAINDAPVVTAGGTLAYTENQAPAVIDATVTVSDADNANLVSATVQISNNYVNGQDVLSFVNTANITGSFNAATGTLTLTGTDTVAAYQSALRTVLYANTSDDPSAAARTVSWTVNDGALDSNVATSTITVTAVNDPPTFTSSNTFTVPENTTAIGTVTTADLESQTVTYSLTGGADQAFFAIDANTARAELPDRA